MLIFILVVSLVYTGFILWFIWRYYLPRCYPTVLPQQSLTSPYRLARTVRIILSFFHFPLFLFAIAWPPIYFTITMYHTRHPSWVKDLNVLSGIKLDSSLLPNLETSALVVKEISGNIMLNIENPSLFAWHLSIITFYIIALITLYIVLQLRNIFVSLSSGEAFTSENSTRMKKIAIAIITSQVVAPLLRFFCWGSVFKDTTFNTLSIQFYPILDLSLVSIFIGLALLVLSGIINEAVKMNDEHRLTI